MLIIVKDKGEVGIHKLVGFPLSAFLFPVCVYCIVHFKKKNKKPLKTVRPDCKALTQI